MEVETVVDTGLAGFLSVPPALVTHLAFVTSGLVTLAGGDRTMTNRMADAILGLLDTTYYDPVPYWCMGEGGCGLTVTVGGSA